MSFYLRRRLSVVFGCLMLAGLALAQERDWPRFYGANLDNKSQETGLLKQWPEASPRLLFKIEGLGQGYANCAVVGDRLYTAGNTARQTVVMAYDRQGQLLWKSLNMASADQRLTQGPGWVERFHGCKSTPTVAGGLVYHLNEMGRLAAFDAATGRERWAVDLVQRFGGKPSPFGYSESVVVEGGRLYVQPGGDKAFFAALDPQNGQTLWTNNTLQDSVASYVTPVVATIQGQKQLVSWSPFHVVGLDAVTGRLLWSYRHQNKDAENIETPLVFGDRVVVSSAYGQKMECIRVQKSGDQWSATSVWTQALADDLHGGLVLHQGFIYGVACRGGRWFCVDSQTGEIRYREAGVGLGELTYADGMLYCLGHRGGLALVPATPQGFEPASTVQLADDGQDRWFVHPVIGGGRLHIRHGDFLYVYAVTGS